MLIDLKFRLVCKAMNTGIFKTNAVEANIHTALRTSWNQGPRDLVAALYARRHGATQRNEFAHAGRLKFP